MKRSYDVKLLLDKMHEFLEQQEADLDFPEIFYEALNDGKKERKQRQHFEYKKFDDTWLSNVEAFFPSLDRITRNLKSTLKYETEILPIEKTKKINPESIRHLSQNTRYIKAFDEENGVIPEKVLNNLSEIEYGIYENRFIMTLILKLKDFLYNRLKVIRTEAHGFKETTFNLNHDFNLNHAAYHLDINLVAKETLETKKHDHDNLRILERAERLYQLVSRLVYSDFMQVMMRFKKVKPPIMKTQIILKNPDFRNAYMLWIYLDKSHVLDYQLEVETKQKRFNARYYDQLNQSLLVFFSTVFSHSDLGSDMDGADMSLDLIKPKGKLDYAENLTSEIPLYDIEPQDASEYYLQKTKRLFNKHYQEVLKQGNNKEQSIRQVLSEQYRIIDQVMEYYFEINQDEDVFDQLISFSDPIKSFDEAYARHQISKASRQVKEKLYLDALALENKWIDEVSNKQKAALDFLEAQGMAEINRRIADIEQSLSKEMLLSERKNHQDIKQDLAKKRVYNDISVRALKNKYDAQLKKFKAQELSKFRKAQEKLKLKAKKDKEKLTLKLKTEKQKNTLLLAEKKEKALKKHQEKLLNEKERFVKKIKKQ